MKKNYIVNITLLLWLTALMGACRNKPAQPVHHAHQEAAIDSNITQLTAPVNARVIGTIPVVQPRKGTRTYPLQLQGIVAYDTRNKTSLASRIAGRIERLYVKYNYQPVNKGQRIMEVYAPDLAAAQRELLLIADDGNPGLLAQAKQRLVLLGMRMVEIEQVLRSRQILYHIPVFSNSDGYILEQLAPAAAAGPAAMPAASAAGDGMGGMNAQSAATPAPALSSPATTPILLREGQYITAGQPLFSIYQANSLLAEFAMPPQQASRIRKGARLQFHPTTDASVSSTATIGLIEPVFRNGQNFSIARVYLGKGSYRPGQLLTANLPVVYEGGWWLPAAAVTQLGNKSVVFRKEGPSFRPVVITPTASVGGMIQTSTDITGWELAAQAAYLVDSESFIKSNQDVQP